MSGALRIEAIVESEVAATLVINDDRALSNNNEATRNARAEMFRAFVAGLLGIPTSNITLRICGKGFDYHF